MGKIALVISHREPPRPSKRKRAKFLQNSATEAESAIETPVSKDGEIETIRLRGKAAEDEPCAFHVSREHILQMARHPRLSRNRFRVILTIGMPNTDLPTGHIRRAFHGSDNPRRSRQFMGYKRCMRRNFVAAPSQIYADIVSHP